MTFEPPTRDDRGTVKEQFSLYMKEIRPFCMTDPQMDRTMDITIDGQNHM